MLKRIILEIIQHTIKKLQPDLLLSQFLKKKEFFKILKKSRSISIISMGKAGYSMAKSFYEYMIQYEIMNKLYKGLVVTPYNTKKEDLENFEIIESSHPYPDEKSLYAGNRLFSLVQSLPLDCIVIVLLSGGASALIEKPIEGISLQEIQQITNELLKSGASIQEINAIRKQLSLIKGGGLAELLYPRKTYQFLLSDVIGKNFETYVSSGPMYIETEYNEEDIKKILEKYHIKFKKTIKIQKRTKTSLKKNYTIGSNAIACSQLKETLDSFHFTTKIQYNSFTGPIEDYEHIIKSDIKNFLKNPKKNFAMIWGGETTVKVQGSGKGGRNQEIALRIAKFLHQYDLTHRNNCSFVSFGTDGIDGPTDAAGGLVFTDSYSKINKILKDLKESITYKDFDDILKNNDSYFALSLIEGLIKTGPTGTNLNDLSFFIYV